MSGNRHVVTRDALSNQIDVPTTPVAATDAASKSYADSVGGAAVTLADVSGTGDESVIGDGTGPTLTTKRITGGTGVTVTSDANQVTIASSAGSAASGFWTPTVTNTVNIAVGPTRTYGDYMQIGNVVYFTYSGTIQYSAIDTNSRFDISLPVFRALNFTAAEEGTGIFYSGNDSAGTGYQERCVGRVYGNNGTNAMRVIMTSPDTFLGNQPFSVTGSYSLLNGV